jgi:hypothetical protein
VKIVAVHKMGRDIAPSHPDDNVNKRREKRREQYAARKIVAASIDGGESASKYVRAKAGRCIAVEHADPRVNKRRIRRRLQYADKILGIKKEGDNGAVREDGATELSSSSSSSSGDLQNMRMGKVASIGVGEGGMITEGIHIDEYPEEKKLDPKDETFFDDLNSCLFAGLGYAYVKGDKDAMDYISEVEHALAGKLDFSILKTRDEFDPNRRGSYKPIDWVLKLCPWVKTLIEKYGGRIEDEVSLMKVGPTAQVQDWHMDSGVIPKKIWKNKRVGFGEENLKEPLKYMPFEIIIALSDKCITRWAPGSQWLSVMSDEEYEELRAGFCSKVDVLHIGDAFVFHPNLIHSGFLPLLKHHECKLHAKFVCDDDSSKRSQWIKAPWERDGSYLVRDCIPKKRRHCFEDML